MKRTAQLSILVALTVFAGASLSACTSASTPTSALAASGPAPAVSAWISASPTVSSSETSLSTKPRPILDGLLMTASGERVIDDSVTTYVSRGAQGWQAATRMASNPIANYRTQLLSKGWKLTVDEPTRLAAKQSNDWITLTSTDVESLTGELPWATVFAYVKLTEKAATP